MLSRKSIGFFIVGFTMLSFLSIAEEPAESENENLEELDVVGYYIPNEKKETTQISNVLSFEAISKTGDSNASEALARVSGLSMGADKAVIVRGLDDRYSQTLLNGAVLPSPEPNKRVAPLELFPTNFMESILVQKTYSPNFPGEYAGGLIELRSKTLPDLPFWKLGFSTGYISNSTFEKGNTYQGGDSDWLATDDGSRDIPGLYDSFKSDGKAIRPFNPVTQPDGLTDEQFTQLTRSFSNNYEVKEETNQMPFGISTSYGNRWDIGLNSYGLVGSISYSTKTTNQEETRASFDANDNKQKDFDYDYTKTTVDLNALISGGVEIGFDNSLKASLLYLKNSTDTVAIKDGDVLDEDANDVETRLEWVERTVVSTQLEGDHYLPITDASRVTWRANYATGQRYAPDTRSYLYSDREDGEMSLQMVQGNSNFYRDYSEVNDTKINYNLQIDFPFLTETNREGKYFVGVDYLSQNQDSKISRFRFNSSSDFDYLTNDIEDIMTAEHINDGDISVEDNTQASDDWDAEKNILSGYFQAEIPLGSRFSFTAGARLEAVEQKVTTPVDVGDDEIGELEDEDLLPVVTSTYQLSESMQVRGAVSRTVARPSFREMSTSAYYDVETGEPFRGNSGLERSTIDNLDLRLEWYGQAGDSWSIGGFYKEFTKPLERTVANSTDEFITIINTDSATNYGVEVEATRYLNFLSDRLSNYYVTANVTFIESQINLGSEKGLVTNENRPMQGQSDFLANLMFGYEDINAGRNATFSYNFTGERIDQIGVSGNEDVIESGHGSLDFNLSSEIPMDRSFKFGLKAKNLLRGEREFKQGSQVVRSYEEPFSISISITKSWEDIPVDIYADE